MENCSSTSAAAAKAAEAAEAAAKAAEATAETAEVAEEAATEEDESTLEDFSSSSTTLSTTISVVPLTDREKVIDTFHAICDIANTGLSRETLEICLQLLELNVSPKALAQVIKNIQNGVPLPEKDDEYLKMENKEGQSHHDDVDD